MGQASSRTSDFTHCVAKNTLNGNGFMGTRGDIATVQCMIDRKAERAANSITGVSAGDAASSDHGGLCRDHCGRTCKFDATTGSAPPFTGQMWNGRAYASYTEGKLTHWRDNQGNYCNCNGVIEDRCSGNE
jgi:hypothetical protein